MGATAGARWRRAILHARIVARLKASTTLRDASHVAVLCRGLFYYFSALHSNGDVAVDQEDLEYILEAIEDDADAHTADPSTMAGKALGLMTTQHRNTWALTRANLVKDSPNNATTLDIIDSALFILVLDDFAPKNIHEAAANCLHGTYDLVSESPDKPGYQAGTCLNRWYDKLQLIVMRDGSAGQCVCQTRCSA